MRRAPFTRPSAPAVMMELPTLRPLTFSPEAIQTHPIDLYDGPQGWGPFYGPWTPWDFRDPAAEISDHYGAGESNDWQFSPPYDVVTLFSDNSLDYVFNTSYDTEVQRDQAERERAYTSTASNAVAPRGESMLGRLRALLQGGEGDE